MDIPAHGLTSWIENNVGVGFRFNVTVYAGDQRKNDVRRLHPFIFTVVVVKRQRWNQFTRR